MSATASPSVDGWIESGLRRRSAPQIWERAMRAAAGFDTAGVRAGETVALLLRNDFPLFEASLAATLLGAYAVPINWHSCADEIGYILDDCGAKALVVHRDLCGRLPRKLPRGMLVLIVDTPPEIVAAYGEQMAPAAPIAADGARDWDDWVSSHEPWKEPPRPLTGTVIYTSGTTGRPKAVVRPPMSADQVDAAFAMVRAMYGFVPGEPIRTVITGPMYHTAPHGYALTAFRMGGQIVLQPRFDPDELLALIERHRITHLHVVPTMFVRLLKLPEATRRAADASSLRWVAHGAAPCPPAVKAAMIDWWGPVINEYYGSTETGGITVQKSADVKAKPGSVGRPLPGVALRICDEHKREVPAGQSGDIYVHTTALVDFKYLGDEGKRSEVGNGAFVWVGDIGYVDPDGYLFLSDRRKDIINSGGVNIYSAEIEAALFALDGIEDCAVIGIPDDEFGEAVCAHVVVSPASGLAAESVIGQLRQRLSKFKVPKRIVFVDSLPREESGKIMKRKIRDEYWHGLDRKI
jgi:long-chain acyl-CoA synthetase